MQRSRRGFLRGALGAASTTLLGQGIAPRSAVVKPRGKASGRPYYSTFTDIAHAAGLTASTLYGDEQTKTYIVEAIGCGCAFLDYDNDGWLDIFVLSGASFGDKSTSASNRLYRNNRDGTFTDVTVKAGLLHSGWACGVAVGDYDNDGNEDLFVTYWGHNILYRNNGDGTFTDVTKTAGLSETAIRWGTGSSFLDYNRDGHLDLFVSNYLDFDQTKSLKPGAGAMCRFKDVPVNCGPRGYQHGKHSLYRNNGDGTFTDVSVASGIASAKESFGLTVVTADFDDDGWPDIYVACDSTPGLLFMNNHDGTFREEATLRGVAYSEDGQEQAGMGVAVADVNGDGLLDIFKTNFSDDLPNLYRNLGKGQFEDQAPEAGLSVDNRFVSWGTGIVDFDNDGLPDIFVVTGHVYPELEKRFPSYPYRGPRLLYRNLGQGHFEEMVDVAGPAMRAMQSSRGCAFGDFDNDGDMDVLVVNLGEPPSLLRNDVTVKRGWLKVKLIGTTSNRSAIGSKVIVTTPDGIQAQEIQSQSSFLSSNDPRIHFGLGSRDSAEVRVRWPSGMWDAPRIVKSNQLITLREGGGIVPNLGWQ